MTIATVYTNDKLTNYIGYSDATGLNNVAGEYQLAQSLVFNGNVYPIYQQRYFVPALPDNTTDSIDHNINDFPTSLELPFHIDGVLYVVGTPNTYRPLWTFGTGLTIGVTSTQIVITTTGLISPTSDSAQIILTYCKQNDFTPITKF